MSHAVNSCSALSAVYMYLSRPSIGHFGRQTRPPLRQASSCRYRICPNAEAGTAPFRRHYRPGGLQDSRSPLALSDVPGAVGALYLTHSVCEGESASNCLLFSVHRLVCALRRSGAGKSPQVQRRTATASERAFSGPVRTLAARCRYRLLADGCGEVTLLELSAAGASDVEGALAMSGGHRCRYPPPLTLLGYQCVLVVRREWAQLG